MDYLLGASIGGLIAFFFSLPAAVLEFVEKGNVKRLPILVEAKTIFHRRLHKEEVFLVAVLLHICLGISYGTIYVWFVLHDWLFLTHTPFTLFSFFLFSLGAFVVTGSVIFPLLGMGLFGRKEGTSVWLEMVFSFLLLGFMMWLVVQFYQPFYFIA
ncbi:MAG: hypothetical protein UU08_C0001G0019 [Candidatus Uhrbacteria bacterium GW2011_GWE2_40_58]|nr:MAG: hypothetical protein UT94_C0001G0019 [Candidatus Uhrbacteria bacterium GW2011_GWF2_40_263]KKR68245.1 MAG: hypothetical protein UU08_C0001G0019 [Candidatus Uhrbacteria bacterium GW2011_GWE2_40_58]OGL92048.1 MAG: hypothetical protein A2239_03480 [Candidatus Uhrbacteria bacterium RIFOXYA2_FULL_40_9]OGL97506.1 MAG: hypothetical protein A2332_00185 [Candidatus Uhrbacteria bacterium RIFOXYB2_FULL_41_18]HBK35107.1 hypothetical protein [Candidatus Uhrbacteria bacterium]